MTGSKRKSSKSPAFRSHHDGLLAPLDALILPDVPPKPYTAEIEQDELILAAIIAGGVASGREVSPSISGCRPEQVGHGHGYGHLNPGAAGPCCAVGAGVLFSGLTCDGFNAPFVFADAYGVTRDYAFGVSSGFEGADRPFDEERGVAVGSAAYDFFQGDS